MVQIRVVIWIVIAEGWHAQHRIGFQFIRSRAVTPDCIQIIEWDISGFAGARRIRSRTGW